MRDPIVTLPDADTLEQYTVVAEDAPIGVQLWPTRSPVFAPNYTLDEVRIVRRQFSTEVVWAYQNGTERTFNLGDEVACAKVKGA